jgi:hypothetical protein
MAVGGYVRRADVNRREFLLSMPAMAQLQVVARSNTVQTTGGEKAVLRESDFKYLGCFRLPRTGLPGGPQYGKGLAHRYVDGQLRFITRSYDTTKGAERHPVYEVEAPGLGAEEPRGAPQAETTCVWGSIYGAGDKIDEVWGFYWDPVDQRLFWMTGHQYNADRPFAPSIGCSTLDDTTGMATPVGVWGLKNRSVKMSQCGLTPVPAWFQAAYCPGRRLAAGFGGNFSVLTVGPVSMGPALAAFDPALFSRAPNRSFVPCTPLLGYPAGGRIYGVPDRAHRDTDYHDEFGKWNPRKGVGYWTNTDYLWQAGEWIDTPTKSGIVFFPTLANGRTWYERSTTHAERSSHAWMVYDPADLARVARGRRSEWDIQPKEYWLAQYPGVTYPMGRWTNGPGQMIVGTTYDATTQILYVAVSRVVRSLSVYAYQVT